MADFPCTPFFSALKFTPIFYLLASLFFPFFSTSPAFFSSKKLLQSLGSFSLQIKSMILYRGLKSNSASSTCGQILFGPNTWSENDSGLKALAMCSSQKATLMKPLLRKEAAHCCFIFRYHSCYFLHTQV